MQHDLPTEPLDSFDLDGGSCRGHADDGLGASPRRAESDALRVVAGGAADDAAFEVVVRQGGHLVVGAAELEGEDGLHVLALEEDSIADCVRQAGRVVQRSLHGYVVHG